MTINEYVTQKFQTFGIEMSEADLLDMQFSSDENFCDEVTKENHRSISVLMVKFIPNLLLRAQSIGEGGFSISWNIQGLMEYYAMACKQYGIVDQLSKKQKVSFIE